MKRKLLSVVLAVTMALTVTACAPKVETPAEMPTETPVVEFTAAMITDTGGVNDQSFNQSAWEGLRKAEVENGIKVKYLESKQDADYGPNLDKLADEDQDIIWAVGYLMADAVAGAAEANPEQLYGIVDFAYEKIPSNVICVNFKAQEPSFMVGYMAAKTTKTDKVGFVGGISGFIIDQFEYGYRAGVAYANKEMGKQVEVLVQYANSFSDDAAGKAIATSMYTQGADIVFHAAGAVGVGVFEAAKDLNKLAIGVDRDQADSAPDNIMSSALKLVGDAMFKVTSDLKNGAQLGGQSLNLGLSDGAVGIPDNESTKKLVDAQVYTDTVALEDLIKNGTIVPPSNEAEFTTYVDGLK